MRKILSSNPLLFAIAVYILARGFMLLVGGVWWDDWLIWNAPRETLVQNWITEGNTPHIAAIHLFIRDHFSTPFVPYVYRLVAFLFGLLNVVLVWHILGYFRFSKSQRLTIVSLFAAAPLNTADITMCCVMYTVSTLLFYGGALLFVKGVLGMRRWAAVISPFLLFLSLFFWMSPIVVIPFLVLVAALERVKPEKWSGANAKAVFMRCLSWWYIWIVPIVYWVVRSIFFAPKAQFGEYYAINPKAVVALPLVIVQSFVNNVVGYFGYIFEMMRGGLIPTTGFIAIAAVIVWVYFKFAGRQNSQEERHGVPRGIFWCALILFAGAVIPATLIGEVGDGSSFTTMGSRYQVLMGVPIALIIFVLGDLFKNKCVKQSFFGVVIALSLIATMQTYVKYQRGWFKELAIAQIIAHDERLQVQGVNVIVKDVDKEMNEYPDAMPDYAYSGMSNLALNHDQTHRYISSVSYEKAVSYNPAVDNYTIAGAEKCPDPTVFHYVLVIDSANDNALSQANILRLTAKQLLAPEAFRSGITGLLKYTLLPIDENTRIDKICCEE